MEKLLTMVELRASQWVAGYITRLTRRAGLRRSRPWYELKRDAGPSPDLAGKNMTFSEKNDRKGSKKRGPVGSLYEGLIEVFS